MLNLSLNSLYKKYSKSYLVKSQFAYGPFNIIIFFTVFMLFFITQQFRQPAGEDVILYSFVSFFIVAVLLMLKSRWDSSLVFTILLWIIFRKKFGVDMPYLILTGLSLGIIFSPVLQIAMNWEKCVILRFGRFSRLKGPGLFLVAPIIETAADFLDQRVKVTDFRAETTLTKDTVPINVDAICFWLIWDAKKAVLEVEDYTEAVILSAQTALRDAIGRYQLSEMLSHRHKLGNEIKDILDEKTSAWVITIQSVEISDIILPKGLEDAMSKQAQAERERQSRIILGTAEIEIAEKFAKASKDYQNNPVALQLRAMNMVYEGLRKKGSMIIVPSTAVETMGLGAIGGLSALAKTASADTDESLNITVSPKKVIKKKKTAKRKPKDAKRR